MSFKRKFIIFSFLFLLGFSFLFVTLTCIYFYIPTYVESELLPEMARKAGIKNYACDVRRIGFFGLDLGSLRIGNSHHPALSIASIQIDYSPAGLYRKELERVVVNGIELSLEYKNGEFIIHPFDLTAFLSQRQSSKKTDSSLAIPPPPMAIRRLEIRNTGVVFNWKGKRLRFPVELEIVSGNAGRNTSLGNELDCLLRLYPRGQEIVVTSSIHLLKKEILLAFTVNALQLERFSDFTALIPGLTVSGEAYVKGNASFQYAPFTLLSASTACRFHRAEMAYSDLRLNYLSDTQKEKAPFTIEISGKGGKEWMISACSIPAVSPLPLLISEINCDLKFEADAAAGSGNFVVLSEPVNSHPTTPVKVLAPFDLKGNYFIKLEKNGEWAFRIQNDGNHPSAVMAENLKFRIRDVDIFVHTPQFDITGKGANSKGSAVYKIVAPGVKVSEKSAAVQMPWVSLKGEAGFSQSEEHPIVSATWQIAASDVRAMVESAVIKIPALSLKGKGGFGTPAKKGIKFASFELKASDTHLTAASANITLPQVSLAGEVRQGKDHGASFSGLFNIVHTRINAPKLRAKIDGIQARVPLKWPFKGTGKKGAYSVMELAWEKGNLGSVKGTVQQKDLGLVFNGVYTGTLLPDMSMNFTGNAGILSPKGCEAGIHFELNPYRTESDLDLEQFIPSAKGVTFNGEFGLNGDWTFDNTGMKSRLNATLNHANLMLKDKKAALEGIQAALSLTDLQTLRSAPKQEFSFEKAALGQLSASNGKIEYQIESPSSFFIEKSSFRWCDGNVHTQAMRISPGIDDYDLILYCDRLKLAMILKQFGAANAKGSGTVNGRLPVRIKNGKIRFNDGFLFSTPGEGGTIRLTGTEILTAGISPDSPQFAQIELAREALKDYDYQWAKLNIISEGEDVLLRLQFDGKPARALPFVYNKKIGGFTKVEAGGKVSIFQGIGLDVNIRVPMDKILHYQDLFNRIQ